LIGAAVKVTEFPIQKGFDDGEMDILTGSKGFTVIVTELLVAGLPEVQVAEEVSVQVIISPLFGI
jgi:hypothetical protein